MYIGIQHFSDWPGLVKRRLVKHRVIPFPESSPSRVKLPSHWWIIKILEKVIQNTDLYISVSCKSFLSTLDSIPSTKFHNFHSNFRFIDKPGYKALVENKE